MKILTTIIIVTTCLWVLPAKASPILSSTGNATSLTDVIVNGIDYKVSFKVGDFNSFFGSDPVPAFEPAFIGQFSLAQQALDAIVSQLNAGSVAFVEDALSGSVADSIIVPYFYNDFQVSGAWTGKNAPLPWSAGSNIGTPRAETDAFGRTYSYAVFARVSEPSILMLMSVGLIVLGLAQRRQPQA